MMMSQNVALTRDRSAQRGTDAKDREARDEEDPFYVGFAISVYQNSGDEQSNWGAWEKRRSCFGLRSTIDNGDLCGISCDFWNRYKEDLERAASVGSNCFRISLEWSRLQPGGPRTPLDPEAVERFHDILDATLAKGMEPFLTLHHFVHPLWFERMGGFEKESNISVFVEYAILAFKEFRSKARFWATFNEPGVTTFAGHIYGSFPPGKMARFGGSGRQLLHMLRSHTEAYDALKMLPGGSDASIGIVHNWFWFEPAKACCVPFYVHWIAGFLNRLWGNDVVLKYLETGIFDWKPLGCLFKISWTNPNGRPGCDHFGLNYYSRGLFDWKLTATANPGEIMTDMPYSLFAEGLLQAVDRISTQLEIPIYITETGVADHGDRVRPIMIQSYMAAVEEVVRRGYDLRGVMYWSLIDNFEWAFGFRMKFGMYEWNHKDSTQQRKERKSIVLLKHWFDRLKSKIPLIQAQNLRLTMEKSSLEPQVA